MYIYLFASMNANTYLQEWNKGYQIIPMIIIIRYTFEVGSLIKLFYIYKYFM